MGEAKKVRGDKIKDERKGEEGMVLGRFCMHLLAGDPLTSLLIRVLHPVIDEGGSGVNLVFCLYWPL